MVGRGRGGWQGQLVESSLGDNSTGTPTGLLMVRSQEAFSGNTFVDLTKQLAQSNPDNSYVP